MKYSWSTQLLMCLSLETLTSIIGTGSPILVELIDLVNSAITFLSKMTLLKWLTFLNGYLTVIFTALLFWIYLFLMTLVFDLQWLSLLGNSDHVVVSISTDFPINSKQDALFHGIAYDHSCADWDGIRDHLRDVPWEDIVKLSTSAAAREFCEWVQVGIDVYIPHCKYQVKPHSSPWFSAACAAAMVHRNHFFRLYQQNRSFESKIKFRYASKQKSIISQKLGSRELSQIANSVLNKGRSDTLPLFNVSEVLSSASDKAKLFTEIFSKNSWNFSKKSCWLRYLFTFFPF